MNLYPALRASMGTWDYFVVKLTMREVSEHVKFASDIHKDHTLDEAIQRTLSESRAKKEIVAYLQRQDHRFFSSLVIAALDGNPQWYPIMIADDPQFAIFKDDKRLNSTFGVLKFDGTQKYYALDGQHRLSAIKTLLDPSADEWRDVPDGFTDEEVSVILVHPRRDEGADSFMLRYRRLFGNLNRHARATSHFTNIVMDEDDTFAILTRRLITEYPFFQSPGRQKESVRIKMRKNKNVNGSSTVFTSLEQLYAINKTLITSADREKQGWDERNFVAFRLDDDVLDELFEEIVEIWDALIKTLPVLRNPPETMRCHDREGLDDGSLDDTRCPHDGCCEDSALFWPLTQDMIARLVRKLLDDGSGDVVKRLAPLADLEYALHRPPWRHLFLIPNDAEGARGGWWKVRNEDRKPAILLLERILWWQLGLVSLNSGELTELRAEWKALLYPQWGDSDHARMLRQQLWAQIEAGRRL